MQEACVVSWCGGELKLLSDPRARESFGGRYSREDNSQLRDPTTEWVAIVIDHLDFGDGGKFRCPAICCQYVVSVWICVLLL